MKMVKNHVRLMFLPLASSRVKKNVCSLYSLKVANIVKLEAILFMLIRWSKLQNSAWEQGKSNSAFPNYAKKSGSQLLLRKASRLLQRPLFQNWL